MKSIQVYKFSETCQILKCVIYQILLPLSYLYIEMHSVMPVKYVEKLRKAFIILMMLAQIRKVNVEIACLHKFSLGYLFLLYSLC